MYEVTIINGKEKTTIHYSDSNAPKVKTLHLNKKRGQAGSLTFTIYPNNPGYNKIIRIATLITVIDIRDNSEVFSGRIYTTKKAMDENGIRKDIVCEGELNYLQDTVQDSVIYEDKTAKEMLQIFLEYHNSQVEDYKRIQLGNVDVEDWIFCTTNNETTLECIQKFVYNENLGYLQLRKVKGIKYLDYIKTTQDKKVEVFLGRNLLNMIQSDDEVFGTRIVPIGANGLTIDNINNGKKYIEDTVAVKKYGIVYRTVEFKDVDDDKELKSQCETQLSNYVNPKQSLEIDAVDLAALAGTSVDMITEKTSVHLINPIMEVDEVWKVVEYDVDLNEVYKPKLTISNKALTLTNSLSSIVGSMVRNDGDYNGVQIGDSFGLRIKKDDVVITLNAKDGISIKNDGINTFYVDTKGHLNIVNGYISLTNGTNTIKIDPSVGFKITKVDGTNAFYVDTNGEVIHDGKHQVSYKGNVLIENWKNDNGGLTQIFDNDKNLNVKIGSENGTSGNIGGTLILYSDGQCRPRTELGISKEYDSGIINLKDKSGVVRVAIYGDSNKGPGIFIIKDSVPEELATQKWVKKYVDSHMPAPTT